MHEPARRVRALHTATSVTVYQAYAPAIGVPAARDGRFPAAWSRERMTWVKPSFLWMMYRCGWGTKPGQETVLAVEISREGFEWALRRACLSHYVREVHGDPASWKRDLRQSPVRVQWDPERDLRLRPLPYRSLQLGLSGEAVRRYADEWITGIRDVTASAHEVRALMAAGRTDEAAALLPAERPYDLAGGLPAALGGTAARGVVPEPAARDHEGAAGGAARTGARGGEPVAGTDVRVCHAQLYQCVDRQAGLRDDLLLPGPGRLPRGLDRLA